MISESTISELKNINLTDIISRYVTLRREGREYVGLCPFHNEKTPSFHVHPTKGYYCFGCGTKGSNPIDFVMRIENKSFTDAVEQLATMTGTMIGKDVAVMPVIRSIESIQPPKPQHIDIIPDELVNANLKAYKRNNLYLFVSNLVGEDKASEAFIKYGIGSCKYYGKGTTLFTQRDVSGNIRQVKVILYDPTTGHRRKEKAFEPKIVGRYLEGMSKESNLVQCFFGEHLLALPENEGKSIAIVESEKTAVMCSIHYPKYVWLAAGGKNGISITQPEVNKVLKGRFIHLLPDVDGVEDWRIFSNELELQGFETYLNGTMASYPAFVGTKKDIADLLTDVPAKPDRLTRLVAQGNTDAKLYDSGAINRRQWQGRVMTLQAAILAAGYNLKEYVQAANHIPDWQAANLKWIWINRLHNGSTDVPDWLKEAKVLLMQYREGRVDYDTYEDKQADVIVKYHIKPEVFVETVNAYINSLN